MALYPTAEHGSWEETPDAMLSTVANSCIAELVPCTKSHHEATSVADTIRLHDSSLQSSIDYGLHPRTVYDVFTVCKPAWPSPVRAEESRGGGSVNPLESDHQEDSRP